MGDAPILHDLALLVGRIDGKLDAHIAAAESDRAARVLERVENEKYRSEIRHRFNNLNMKVDAIPRLEKRVEIVEGTADDWQRFRWKLVGAIVAIGTIVGIIGQAVIFFAAQIKAAVMHLFGVSSL